MSFLGDLWPDHDQPLTALDRFMMATGALYLGLGLGIIAAAPQLLQLVSKLDAVAWTDVGLARVVGLAVGIIGSLYLFGARSGGASFALATAVERMVVVVMLAGMWSLGELPGLPTFMFCTLNLLLASGVIYLWKVEPAPATKGGGQVRVDHLPRRFGRHI